MKPSLLVAADLQHHLEGLHVERALRQRSCARCQAIAEEEEAIAAANAIDEEVRLGFGVQASLNPKLRVGWGGVGWSGGGRGAMVVSAACRYCGMRSLCGKKGNAFPFCPGMPSLRIAPSGFHIADP